MAERKRNHQPKTEELERQLAAVEREIENIMTAIKAGIITETTKTELEKAEAEKKRLLGKLSDNPNDFDSLPDILPQAVEHYKRLVNDLDNTTQKQVALARSAVKALIGEEVRLVPDEDENCLIAELSGCFEGLINNKAALVGGSKINVVAGAGFIRCAPTGAGEPAFLTS